MGMKYVGAYLLGTIGNDGTPATSAQVKKIIEAGGGAIDDDILSKFMSQVEGKDIHELITAGREKLKNFGGGGGGGAAPAAGGAGGAAPAEAKKEEVVEEEEEEDMEFDLFG